MASAQVASRPPPDRPRRKPFTQWVKNLTNLKNKSGDAQSSSKKGGKKGATLNGKNNPYPQSGHHLQQGRQSPASSANGHLSFSSPIAHEGRGSFGSLSHDRDAPTNSNRSGAPTLATNPETIHSDAGHSKAATTTTHGGALSSLDGAGADSTFSSPSQSQHSLTTTLTTIQSTSAGNALHTPSGHHHSGLNNPNPVMFTHQYPVSPAPSAGNTISAIPRHVTESTPATYNSATANNLLTDNASILTLASSSKRRRRSMDTDASVRALAPSSVWGGSRESLPLSVLSGNPDAGPATSGGGFYSSQSRPSIGGIASAERASIYSNHGAGIASERNSYYSHRPGKDLADAKSLRSVTNMETRSLAGDARSINADAKSLGGDVASLRNNEGSIRSGAMGHSRNDSIPGSIGSPLTGPNSRHLSGTGALSRRSSDWQEIDGKENDDPMPDDDSEHVKEAKGDADQDSRALDDRQSR